MIITIDAKLEKYLDTISNYHLKICICNYENSGCWLKIKLSKRLKYKFENTI